MYTFGDAVDKDHITTIHDLLKETYWAKDRTRDDIEASLDRSIVVAAFDGEALVGFGRAVTDTVTFAWICDVVVAPAHRKKGIGKTLVKNLLAHPDVVNTRKVLVTRDAQTLYRSFGFQTHPSECMVKYRE